MKYALVLVTLLAACTSQQIQQAQNATPAEKFLVACSAFTQAETALIPFAKSLSPQAKQAIEAVDRADYAPCEGVVPENPDALITQLTQATATLAIELKAQQQGATK